MRLDYAISLWNYSHYASVDCLEREIALIHEQGYGVELWGYWRDGRDLFGEEERARLRPLLRGTRVSLHTALSNRISQHQKQIDAAADWGARVVVVHVDDLRTNVGRALDLPLARDVVAYAAERSVRIALENGQLGPLVEAIDAVDDLGICLDVGHVYLTPHTMRAFLEALQDRIIHLHLQDILSGPEKGLPAAARDHYSLGTGGIPLDDWELLVDTLGRIEFEGTAVFEIRPRTPLQTALLGARFMDGLILRHV